MRFLPRQTRYPAGSRVKRKNGPIMVKTDDGSWISENRFLWDQYKTEKLEDGDRVFFADGNPENNKPSNLVKVRFGNVRYRFRQASGPLYIPGVQDKVKVRVA